MELINWYSERLPDYSPEPEEVEAGYERLQKAFGSIATITEAAKALGERLQDIYLWSAKEFYTQQLYLSHRAHVDAEYRKLIMNKK